MAGIAASPVDERQDLSIEEFSDRYLAQNKPVVLRGGVRHWKAVRDWNPAYLVSRLRQRKVSVSVSAAADEKYEADVLQMEFDKYAELIARNTPELYYIRERPLRAEFPELVEDVEPPIYLPKSDINHCALFLGRDNTFPSHYHRASEALQCQIVGTKRFLLVSPDQGSLLYGRQGAFSNKSGVTNLDSVDLERFPRFAEVKPLSCTVTPGDMLFVPIHWWHSVHSTGLSIAVTFFYRASLRRVLSPPEGVMGLLAMLGRPGGLLSALGFSGGRERW